jgi:hypothetical protein
LKCFLDLNVEDERFEDSSFAKDRRRLPEHRINWQSSGDVVGQARRRYLVSSQHFT